MNAPRETLQSGDLCVIIRPHPSIPRAEGEQIDRFVGLTVILIEHHHLANSLLSAFSPYWRCSGLPPAAAVSHVVLKKIPPDRMLDARTHMTDTPVTDDEELTV